VRAFALLTLAALRAAARSFGIWAVALLCALSLLFLQTCAGCAGAGTLVLNGESLLLGGALSELTALAMALGLQTSTCAILKSTRRSASPRRTVSTSGSSGNGLRPARVPLRRNYWC